MDELIFYFDIEIHICVAKHPSVLSSSCPHQNVPMKCFMFSVPIFRVQMLLSENETALTHMP
uniref:Uncharacterized protein n=1 Tax=Anguilla anguilla TaxID=7936 RepID=A0A0E9XTF5_ANGAN